MNAVVVDTDVVSLIFKGDSRADKYLPVVSGQDLLVSLMNGSGIGALDSASQVGPDRIGLVPDVHKAFCFGALFA